MERRRGKRLKIDQDVILNGTIKAEGLDFSEDGMYVYVKHNFVPDSIVDLKFNLDDETINISARIQHSQPGIGFGVNFFDFPEEVKHKIEQYAERLQNISE